MPLELQNLMNMFNIGCPRCLDTKILWKHRDNVFFARMDGNGDYDIFNCNECSNGLWNKFSHAKDIIINDIHIFNINTDAVHRIQELKKKAVPILKKEKEEIKRHHEEIKRQQEEIERHRDEIKNQQNELDRQKNELTLQNNENINIKTMTIIDNEDNCKNIDTREDCEGGEDSKENSVTNNADQLPEYASEIGDWEIELAMKEQREHDDNPEPIWFYYNTDIIEKEIKSVDIDIEIGKIAERVCNSIKAAYGDVFELPNLIRELKVDLKTSIESSLTNKIELKQVKDSEERFTYIVFIFSNHIEKIFCECLEWCGFNNRTNKFSLQYTIIKPKNKAAQRECEKHMSNNIKLN